MGYEKILKPGKYIILLQDLEFAMSPSQLERILDMHNQGMKIEEIAEKEKRDPYEVILALLHQARKSPKSIKKPIGYRYRIKDDVNV